MLDAFIIDRIRQRQNRPRESAQVPLRIEVPDHREEPPRRGEEKQNDERERGIVTIDFTI